MSETAATYMRERPEFDPVNHAYTLRGAKIPNVTSIIKAVIPVEYHGATQWHLDRGTIVHQCAAMLCRGQRFVHDPQIDGQVRAVKSWLAMRRPEILRVEKMVWSEGPIVYAGTLDLLCCIAGKLWVIDWKGSASPWDQWQLGAYAHALQEEGIRPEKGLVVEVGESGNPNEVGPINLRSARNEWRSILNVYQILIRERLLK